MKAVEQLALANMLLKEVNRLHDDPNLTDAERAQLREQIEVCKVEFETLLKDPTAH